MERRAVKLGGAHFDLQPTLESQLLILRPLREDDFESLRKVASDPLIWEQHPAKRYQSEIFESFFKASIASHGAFAVIEKMTGLIIGSTRFQLVKGVQDAVEIGWTFLARQYWGGSYNKSMKQLMIDHAFLFVEHVLFFIGENNIRSQRAVEKIGGARITALQGRTLEAKKESPVIYGISKESWESRSM